MNQYQRMVSYLYEYKQGVKGVNVGYVRIEQRAGTCRISLQMRSRNLGQLPDVAVFHQRADGIRYFPLGSLTERNGDCRCRIDTNAENLMDSGISLSDVDGIILYQDDTYYIATTWKNQGIRLGKRGLWNPAEPDDGYEPEQEVEQEPAPDQTPERDSEQEAEQTVLEQSDMQEADQTSVRSDDARDNGQLLSEENHSQNKEQSGSDQKVASNGGRYWPNSYGNRDGRRYWPNQDGYRDGGRYWPNQDGYRDGGRYWPNSDGDRDDGPFYPEYRERQGRGPNFMRGFGYPFFRQNGMWNGRQSNFDQHYYRQDINQSEEISNDEKDMENGREAELRRQTAEQREQMETQAVCRNCPFKRKSIDYGKRILMTFPIMRPFPNDQTHACVRIEPQDLGCLPMQLWSLANNHFLLQGYYCYRHLIFLETENQGYALGVPGIYGARERGQAEQFGFSGFRSICSGKQCEGAFGYWMMPLSF